MENMEKKATPGKIALAVAAVIVLAAALIAIVVTGLGGEEGAAAAEIAVTEETVEATIPADGNPEDETAKGSYTASDEEVAAAADTVVATMGEHTLTNGQLQMFYWMEVQSFLGTYGSYAPYIGLNATQPLDTQVCSFSENGTTWQQFFLAGALNTWRNYQAMAAEADKAGFQLDAQMQDMLDNGAAYLEQDAVAMGYESAKDYLADNVGNAARVEDFVHFLDLQYHGIQYFDTLCESNLPTDAEMEAYFTENEAAYLENGLSREDKYVDVRHVLVMPEGADSSNIRSETFPEEAWETAKAEAEQLLADWEQGDKSEESFAQLAMDHSDDGSASTGGLFTNVAKGQMVEAFETWCFDESRKPGDYGMVETEFGYHLMFFVDSRPVWKEYVESDMMNQRANELLEGILENYTLEADFTAMLLGYVDLGGETAPELTETAVYAEPLLDSENMPVLVIAGVSLAALAATAMIFKKKEH